MNLRVPTLLCASFLLAVVTYAQAPTAPANTAGTAPPRAAVPQGYQAVVPPSPGDLTVWPRGISPQEVGKALAEHFVTNPLAQTVAYPAAPPRPGGNLSGAPRVRVIGYPEVCTWYGALTFAQLTHDDKLRDELVAKFAPVMPGGAEAARWPLRHHVDDSITGVVPLQIAIQTKGLPTYDPKYLEIGVQWADRQWGAWPPTRRPNCRRMSTTPS